MDSSKKTCNDQGKKKMLIKMGGGGGGGGIGAVVLLGGVLATAAFASAFVVRRKGRSSGEDRRRRHQNPPPEINKQSEQDEANKGQEFIFSDQPSHVYKHQSEGAKKEVESDNDTTLMVSTQSSTLDEKARVEINTEGTPGDVEASEQILCSISPRKLEKDVVSDDGFVIIEEDEKLPLEPQNKMPEDEKTKVQLTKEDVSNDNSKGSKNLEQVYIEEEKTEREPNDDDGEIEATSYKEAVEVTEMQPRQEENTKVCYDQEGIDQMEAEKYVNMELNMGKKEMEGFCSDNGVNTEEKCLEATERAKVDLAANGFEFIEDEIGSNQEAIVTDSSLSEIIVSESHSEDGQKTLFPVDSPGVENDNVDGVEKEGALPTETVEIVQEDEAIEGSQKDEVKYIEEKLVKEQEKCDQPDEGIVSEKCEEVAWMGEAKQSHQVSEPIEVKGDKIPCENQEENGCIVHPSPENILPMLEELISPEDNEVRKEDGANEEVAETLEVHKDMTPVLFDAKKNVEKEVEEELISPEDIEIPKDGANEEVPESLELNENETSIQFPISQTIDHIDDLERNAEKKVEEELISHENVKATKDDIVNEEVAESLEVHEDKTPVLFDAEKKVEKEVKEELISPEDIEIPKDGANEEAPARLEMNENGTSMQFPVSQTKDLIDDLERDAEKEVEEELISHENIKAKKVDIVNEEVAESLEVHEDKTPVLFDAKKKVEKEVKEELISPEDIEIPKDGANEEAPASLEMNENGTSMQFPVSQTKDLIDDLERNAEKEVEEELISHENIKATKVDIVNEEVAESAEESEKKSLTQFVVGQPKELEDDFERNIAREVEYSSETINAGIATGKDVLIMEMSDDEEKGADKIKDFNDEAPLSDEVEENSVGTGGSSTESNSEAVWPAKSLKESSMEPQQVKLINYEVEGKVQEDKAVKEGEHDSQTIDGESEENNSHKSSENFPTVAEKTFIKKYMVELGTLKDHHTNSTRRRMIIGTLSVLSSLSCSWFFGLSFVKLCLIVFLTMVLSEIHGY